MKSSALWFYVLLSVFTAMQATLNSDESKAMIGAVVLYYSKGICAMIMAGLLAAKIYFSKPPEPPTTGNQT